MAPGQPQAGGHGAYGGGGSEHEGHDQVGQGHAGGTRQAGQAEVGAQPSHPGERLGLVGTQAGLQGGVAAEGGPGHTSQTCSRCGHVHRDNRPSQAVFACGACGFRANADHNAAVNILVRARLPCVPVSARGTGASARRGAIPWGTPTTRERDWDNLHVKSSCLGKSHYKHH